MLIKNAGKSLLHCYFKESPPGRADVHRVYTDSDKWIVYTQFLIGLASPM